MLKFLIPTGKLYKITQEYGANFKNEDGSWRYNPYHHGTDYRTKTPQHLTGEGLPILACQEGQVTKAYNSPTYGLCVQIAHTGKYKNFYSLYAHLSKIDVKAGDIVSPGWQLGLSGNTGASKGNHLHFELRAGEDDIKHVVNPQNPKDTKNLGDPPVDYMFCESLTDDWEEVAQAYAIENNLILDWKNPYLPISQVRFAEILRRFEIYIKKKYNIY